MPQPVSLGGSVSLSLLHACHNLLQPIRPRAGPMLTPPTGDADTPPIGGADTPPIGGADTSPIGGC